MASIIRSIAFKNFYNFYGDYEDNTYEFNEGLNIINADNGMGKSKLFNGILWILQDQVYDSDDRQKYGVMHAALKILSKKAKSEMSPEAGVKIVYEDQDNRYTVTKELRFKRKSATSNPEDADSWNLGNMYVEVKKRDLVKQTDTVVYDTAKQEEIIKDRLVSRELLTYSLLQGEAIDDIVNLSNSSKLSETIETLTDLSALNAVQKSCEKMVGSAESELQAKQRSCTKNANDFDEAQKKKKEYDQKIEKCVESIQNYKEQLRKATELRDKLATQLSNTEQRVQFRDKCNTLQAEIDRCEDERANLHASINDFLFRKPSPWLLIGTEDMVNKFIDRRAEYVANLLAAKASVTNSSFFAHVLPEGSPDDASLDKMLEECKCFVCGREFQKGDEHYQLIEKLRNRSHEKPTVEEPKVKQLFDDIQKAVAPYMHVDSIFGEIASIRKRDRELEERIKGLKADKANAIIELQNYGGKADDLNNTSDADMLIKYNKAVDDVKEYDNLLKSAETHKAEYEDNSRYYEKKMAEYGGAAVPQSYKDLEEVMTDVFEIFTRTKKRIYDEVISTLENKSNYFYQKLTSGGNVEAGKLVFSKTSYDAIQLKVITNTGGEFTGASEGFQRMKKIAVVMAIISSKFGGGHFNYPFIADAPFSAFGKKFIHNFFEAVPDVFSQCIIMIKDLYDVNDPDRISADGHDILNKMVNGELKGTFYVNSVPEDSNESGMVTNIHRLK